MTKLANSGSSIGHLRRHKAIPCVLGLQHDSADNSRRPAPQRHPRPQPIASLNPAQAQAFGKGLAGKSGET